LRLSITTHRKRKGSRKGIGGEKRLSPQQKPQPDRHSYAKPEEETEDGKGGLGANFGAEKGERCKKRVLEKGPCNVRFRKRGRSGCVGGAGRLEGDDYGKKKDHTLEPSTKKKKKLQKVRNYRFVSKELTMKKERRNGKKNSKSFQE